MEGRRGKERRGEEEREGREEEGKEREGGRIWGRESGKGELRMGQWILESSEERA